MCAALYSEIDFKCTSAFQSAAAGQFNDIAIPFGLVLTALSGHYKLGSLNYHRR